MQNRIVMMTFCFSFVYIHATKDFFSYQLDGYVKYESFLDTRQVVGSGDDYDLEMPEPPKLDVLGKDINRKAQYNMGVLESRTKLTVFGPSFYDAKTSATFEVDMAGRSNIIHLPRVRHAYFSLDWSNSGLLVGHTWHPFYSKPYTARVLSNDAGSPFEPYGRNPQIRIYHKYHLFEWYGALLAQADSLSDGPLGESSTYLRNSLVPIVNIGMMIKYEGYTFGCGVDYKRICPRLVTNNNISVSEQIGAPSCTAFFDMKLKDFRFLSRVTYAQNLSDLDLLGGYAVSAIDPITEERQYKALRSFAWSGNLIYKGIEQIELGIFGGYSKNLGASDPIITSTQNLDGTSEKTIYGFANNARSISRASAFAAFNKEPLMFGVEVEYTRVPFGDINEMAKVINAKPVHNTRFLITAYYYF